MDTPVDRAQVSARSQQYVLPASFAQQRVWFLNELEGPGAAYHVRLPLRLQGTLDVERLQRSIDLLVERHETLRTTFALENGEPVQVVHEKMDIPLHTLDMQGAASDVVGVQVAELACRSFCLEKGPLFRVYLLRIGDLDNLLLLHAHHIISDAWSSSVMFSDLAAIYDALGVGDQPRLADLPVQYADFAAWQREWLEGRELQSQIDYWCTQLAGAPPLLALPTDRSRPARQTYNGTRLSQALTVALTRRLRDVAADHGCTLFMVLLAAFNVLLSRYSGQHDVVVGTPIAGRRRSEFEGLIGLFVNTLALRNDLSGNPAFTDLLARVRQTSLDAFAHQDLPFEKLVEVLQPERNLSHSPVFQVMFVLQNAPWDAAPMRGIEVAPGEIAPGNSAKFDLTLSAGEFEGALWLSFEYNTDLFDTSTIEAFAEGFEVLLSAIVDDPGQAIHQLPVQTSTQAKAVCESFNQTSLAYDRSVRMHELIDAQRASRADHPAVEYENTQWSYGQLLERADRIRDSLGPDAAGCERIVGVCLDPSPAMLAAMIGVLRSGAAYLPLDPAYPAERIRFMLDDAGADVLVTDSEHVSAFADGISLLILDSAAEVVQHSVVESSSCSTVSGRGGELAYLMYTSGSTGRPKGVRVPHSAVVNFLLSMSQQPGMRADDRLLSVTTPCFDISVLELFLPLVVGGTVVIAPRRARADGHGPRAPAR